MSFKRKEVGGKELGRVIIGVWKWNKWVLRCSSDGKKQKKKIPGACIRLSI